MLLDPTVEYFQRCNSQHAQDYIILQSHLGPIKKLSEAKHTDSVSLKIQTRT